MIVDSTAEAITIAVGDKFGCSLEQPTASRLTACNAKTHNLCRVFDFITGLPDIVRECEWNGIGLGFTTSARKRHEMQYSNWFSSRRYAIIQRRSLGERHWVKNVGTRLSVTSK